MADLDLLVVGGGPAGLVAAATAAEAGAEVVIADPQLGGHLVELSSVEVAGVAPGTGGYSFGLQLQERLSESRAAYLAAAVDVMWLESDRARATIGGTELRARRVLVATGRGPGLNPAAVLAGWEGRGVFHCASCDGPLVRGRPVVALVEGPVGLAEAIAVGPFTDRLILLVPPGFTAEVPGAACVRGDRPVRLHGAAALTGVELASGRLIDAEFLLAKDEGRPEPPAFLEALRGWGGLGLTGHVVVRPEARTLDELLKEAGADALRLLEVGT